MAVAAVPIAGAAIGAVGSIVGGLFGKHSANKAAKAEAKAQMAGIAEQRRQFDVTNAQQQPFLKLGRFGVNNLLHADTRFKESPGYQFRLNEGQRDIGNSFAARGGAFGGNALRALTDYNQGSASNEFGNWWNQQAGLTNGGQTSANALGSFGANAANNIQQGYSNIGDARASGIVGGANALSHGISEAANQWNYYRGRG